MPGDDRFFGRVSSLFSQWTTPSAPADARSTSRARAAPRRPVAPPSAPASAWTALRDSVAKSASQAVDVVQESAGDAAKRARAEAAKAAEEAGSRVRATAATAAGEAGKAVQHAGRATKQWASEVDVKAAARTAARVAQHAVPVEYTPSVMLRRSRNFVLLCIAVGAVGYGFGKQVRACVVVGW